MLSTAMLNHNMLSIIAASDVREEVESVSLNVYIITCWVHV